METMTTDFFKQLHKADPAVRPRSITILFEPMISQEMNNDLCKEFTEEEISNAMFQIGPLKAPGPNGLVEESQGIRRKPTHQDGAQDG
jgi:hypothetical protein